VFDADFRDKRVIVFQVFVHNRGDQPLVVRRSDIALALPGGREMGPTSATAVAGLFDSSGDVMAWALAGGIIGAIAASSAAETEASARRADYQGKELKDAVKLAPGEVQHGFVFFVPPRGTPPFDDTLLTVRFTSVQDAPVAAVRVPVAGLGFRGAKGWDEEPRDEPRATGPATGAAVAAMPPAATARPTTGADADLRVLLGTWSGTGPAPIFTAQDLGLQATFTLKVLERDGRLVWQMTRVYRGQEFRSAGTVARSDDGIALRHQEGTSPITYTVVPRGTTLEGRGLGADNRVRTFTLTRTE